MAGRYLPALVLLAAAISGCAAVSEERLAKMEADIAHLQAQEIRLAVLEDTVNKVIVAQKKGVNRSVPPAPAPPSEEPRAPAYAPRRVEPAPAPAPAPKPAPKPARTAASTPAKSVKFAAREYQAALSRLEAGHPKTAKDLFKTFLAAYPAHALAPNAGYWLGECHYTLRQYDSAIIAFKDVVAQFPKHDKAAAAMLKAGYSYLQLGDKPNARFYLETLVKDYPASKPASLARERLAAL